MKKITFTMIAVFLGLLLTSQAFAWGPGPGKKSGYCRGVVLEELNVTEDQKTKLDALQLQHFKAVHPCGKRYATNLLHCVSYGCRSIRIKTRLWPNKKK